MPFPLRNRAEKLVHHVVVKTFRDEITLVDYLVINPLIGGILARYQAMFGIIIYSFCINGNHIHLMLQAPNRNLEAFMQYVLREISRRMRKIVPRPAGQPFWATRYSDQIVPTDEDNTELFLYTSTNAVKHGLESSMENYPGLNSLAIARAGGKQDFEFVHYSKKDKNGNFFKTSHTLILSKLETFARENEIATDAYLNNCIREREALIARIRVYKPALGREFLCAQKPGFIIVNDKQKRRPTIYTKSRTVLLEWRRLERERRYRYDKLSRAYRAGNKLIEFPTDCYPPAAIKSPNSYLIAA